MDTLAIVFIVILFFLAIWKQVKKNGSLNYDNRLYKKKKQEYNEHSTVKYSSDMYMSQEDKIEYMKSQQWISLKNMILIIQNNKCCLCEANERLETHHTTYKRLGNELWSDLQLLCRDCHQAQHDEYGYDRETTYLPLIKKK